MKQTTIAQVRQMHSKWPEFQLIHRSRRHVCWEGELRPFHKTYRVGVAMHLTPPDGGLLNPLVAVLNPRLHGRQESPDEEIPHVYPNPADPLLPFLCLFHPPTDRFDPRRDSVANTIVPWTTEWLACYEGWLATGKWFGGGVNHD